MPSTLTAIRDATDRVEDADTQLDELAAMVDLRRLVVHATAVLIQRALLTYTGSEVAHATGLTRQAMNRKRRNPPSTKGTAVR